MNNIYKISILPGDGIGPEVTNETVKVLKACAERFNFKLNFDTQLIGAVSITKTGVPLTDEVIENCLGSDATLLGAIEDSKYDRDPILEVRPEEGLLKLRQSLGVYANILSVKIKNSLIEQSPLKSTVVDGTDIVIFRELTGGIYSGKNEITTEKTSDFCDYSVNEIERIAHLAFKAAEDRSGRLCLVGKANVLESSRLWRKVVTEIAFDYPDVELTYMYVDNASIQLVSNPKQFDVILTENLFGDTLSDLASVLSGSLGRLPSSSIGNSAALFESCQDSYSQLKGLNKANPLATILSGALLLDYLGEKEGAKEIIKAVSWTVEEGLSTEDINSDSPISCSSVGDNVVNYIRKKGKMSPFKLVDVEEDFLYR
jgi:3-isopropylmalate dehydrogenase